MYNNEVTYADKWETPENKAALNKLDEKYFDRSEAYPSCPVGWAVEVLELLETLDKEFGIAYNTSTMRSYYIQGTPFNHFFVDPFKNAYSSFYSDFIETINPNNSWEVERRNKPVLYRLKKVLKSALHPISYGARAFRITHINPLLNKIYKPKIHLGQIKEKYGELTFYYSSPDYLEPLIDKMVAKTELKLAIKGCYFPVESLWRAGSTRWVGTENSPDIITTEVKKDYKGEEYIEVYSSSHRAVMKELGLDLKDIEKKHKIYQEKLKQEREARFAKINAALTEQNKGKIDEV